jgi:hypothetical protein
MARRANPLASSKQIRLHRKIAAACSTRPVTTMYVAGPLADSWSNTAPIDVNGSAMLPNRWPTPTRAPVVAAAATPPTTIAGVIGRADTTQSKPPVVTDSSGTAELRGFQMTNHDADASNEKRPAEQAGRFRWSSVASAC